MIIGDEKWVLYNVTRKKSWGKSIEPPQLTLRREQHFKKVMPSAWWDYKGAIYYELLPPNQATNCEKILFPNDNLENINRRKVTKID